MTFHFLRSRSSPMVVNPKTTAFTASEVEHMAAIFFYL
jgi:hypothetical protein